MSRDQGKYKKQDKQKRHSEKMLRKVWVPCWDCPNPIGCGNKGVCRREQP